MRWQVLRRQELPRYVGGSASSTYCPRKDVLAKGRSGFKKRKVPSTWVLRKSSCDLIAFKIASIAS